MAPIVALDVATLEQVNQLLEQLGKIKPQPIIKIGMEAFYHFGQPLIQQIRENGFDVFLDLKLHDIPNTVARAARVIGSLGVQITTVHAAGGAEMLTAARAGLIEGATKIGAPTPKLLAITQLTSNNEQILHEQQHVALSLPESVQAYATLAEDCRLDGVICSAQEVAIIRAVTQKRFLCVTPGIRPAGFETDDQKRVVTPEQAFQLGSNGIVVGRPITQSKDPIAAYQSIAQAFKGEN